MAINHNFKEGIDWAADPTGETPLANHVFVSKSGNDGTGTGTPQNPYLTIAQGVSVVGSTLVVGTGIYTVDDLTIDGLGIIGDGYVVFKKGAGTSGLFAPGKAISNIIFQNYDIETIYQNAGGAVITVNDCVFIDSEYGSSVVGAVTTFCNFTRCVFINSDQSDNNNIGNYNFCKLFNSNISIFGLNNNKVSNSFIDQNSICEIGVGDTSVDFINNAINGSFINNSTGTVENNLFNINAAFNNVSGFDFSVTSESPLIGAGENGSNIGDVFIGSAYYQGVSLLDTPIDANANIAYDGLGQISLQAGAGDSVVIETLEEESLELSVLGAINLSGFPNLFSNTPDSDNTLVNPNNLILEINVALLDGIYLGWKKYRWNERPTQNTDGTSNGESSYNYADNNKVRWKKRKFRITILNDGIYNEA